VTRSIGLPTLIAIWIVAELYQLFYGAFTSVQIAAPGVGIRSSWAPNLLVAETITLLPLGFVLCLWGTRIGRLVAIGCGLAMIAVDVATAAALGRDPGEAVSFFVTMAPPWLALFGALRLRRVRPTA
jgi:hypothetical protein